MTPKGSVSCNHSVGLQALFATENKLLKKTRFLTFTAVKAIICGGNPVIIMLQDLLVVPIMVPYLRNQACASPGGLNFKFFFWQLSRYRNMNCFFKLNGNNHATEGIAFI